MAKKKNNRYVAFRVQDTTFVCVCDDTLDEGLLVDFMKATAGALYLDRGEERLIFQKIHVECVGITSEAPPGDTGFVLVNNFNVYPFRG